MDLKFLSGYSELTGVCGKMMQSFSVWDERWEGTLE